MSDNDLMTYFIDETNKTFGLLRGEIQELRKDVQKLNSFRLTTIAMASAASSVLAVLIQLVFIYWRK